VAMIMLWVFGKLEGLYWFVCMDW